MPDTKRQVIERIDELIPALAAYEDRCGRAIELAVYGDGTCILRGSDAHLCFEQEIGRFRDLDGVADVLFGRAEVEL